MGSVSREEGVLKLVHPGRFVEIHRHPITAAQVVEKYPRHSVTRPDVFKYPWIVVKPESVLNLGKVFFIVPNRTIYKLLKARRESCQESPERSNISETHVQNKQVQKQSSSSPSKSDAGSTPKHLSGRHQRLLNQSPTTTSCIRLPSLDQGRDSRIRKQNKVGSWPEVMVKHNSTQLRLEDKAFEDSRSKIIIRPSCPEEEGINNIDKDNIIVAEICETNDSDLEFSFGKEVTVLKSCLRKPESDRRLRKLKVSFLLPTKEEEQPRKRRVSPEEFAGKYFSAFADFPVHHPRHDPT